MIWRKGKDDRKNNERINLITCIERGTKKKKKQFWQRPRVLLHHTESGKASAGSGHVLVRFASAKILATKKPTKPPVLEKPSRFNPPSHGSRLPKKQGPKHYGGDLSEREYQAREAKEYPGMMAPKGTTAHWFWHNRMLHAVMSLGTLAVLAIYTWVENFKRSSPYVDMLPAFSDFFTQPISSASQLVQVIRLNTAHHASIVHEKRMMRVNDVQKRQEYRKAHGLDPTPSVPWLPKEKKPVEAPISEADVAPQQETLKPGEAEAGRKKWLGIL
ncbi:hypothetical protein P8C59_005175 [Phyllachora maydis]|uniref:Uncharacterized protein n=1 Tax=Phyllachora maydis TaxID=1825666 RepID=A0AAD9I553_9PEZI|nr:hypothetical protein P8C59_005175 [Phyllachora maydis]